MNCGVISNQEIKLEVLKSSVFAVSKSGTISIEICNAKVPSIIIYKMNIINFLIIKMLVKVKYANIINIAADEEILPELLQSKCNPENIFLTVDKFLKNKEEIKKQIMSFHIVIDKFKTKHPSKIASSILINHF